MKTIHVIINASSGFGRSVIRGVGSYARQRPDKRGRWRVILDAGTFGVPALDPTLPPPDGIIARITDRPTLRRLKRCTRLPIIDVSDQIPDHDWPRVRCDSIAAANAAARHLRERGYRHFAFCGFKGQRWSRARELAFRTAVDEIGGTFARFNGRVTDHDGSLETDLAELSTWLAKLPRPVGLLASNDWRGQHVLIAAEAAGLRVPHDLGVVGIDNDDVVCDVCPVPLTSIDLDTHALGFEAARRMDAWLRSGTPPRQAKPCGQVAVVARRSTDVLLVDDEMVREALRLMNPAGVFPRTAAEVIERLPISRRPFEKRFREATGMTPHEALIRFRIERAAHLLATTDVNVQAVAERCGFGLGHQLAAAFRRQRGVTPTQFRKQLAERGGRSNQP